MARNSINKPTSRLKIVAGEWRSRHLYFEALPSLRPTPARIRETLFNWLQHNVAESHCLDLFSGSGILGFEAASRGANSVLMVEQNSNACHWIKQNSKALSAHQIKIIHTDTFQFLRGDTGHFQPFNLVFLDPPFARDWAQKTCHCLENNNWLATRAKIYVETESLLVLDNMPKNWQCLKHKKAGQVAYYLFESR